MGKPNINEIATINRQTVERITLDFLNDDRRAVAAWLYDNGYTVLRSGPMPAGTLKVSTTHQRWIAEREIDD